MAFRKLWLFTALLLLLVAGCDKDSLGTALAKGDFVGRATGNQDYLREVRADCADDKQQLIVGVQKLDALNAEYTGLVELIDDPPIVFVNNRPSALASAVATDRLVEVEREWNALQPVAQQFYDDMVARGCYDEPFDDSTDEPAIEADDDAFEDDDLFEHDFDDDLFEEPQGEEVESLDVNTGMPELFQEIIAGSDFSCAYKDGDVLVTQFGVLQGLSQNPEEILTLFIDGCIDQTYYDYSCDNNIPRVEERRCDADEVDTVDEEADDAFEMEAVEDIVEADEDASDFESADGFDEEFDEDFVEEFDFSRELTIGTLEEFNLIAEERGVFQGKEYWCDAQDESILVTVLDTNYLFEDGCSDGELVKYICSDNVALVQETACENGCDGVLCRNSENVSGKAENVTGFWSWLFSIFSN